MAVAAVVVVFRKGRRNCTFAHESKMVPESIVICMYSLQQFYPSYEKLHCMHVPSVWHLKGLTMLVHAHLCIMLHIIFFTFLTYHIDISNILIQVSNDSPNIVTSIYIQFLCILSIWWLKIIDFGFFANPSHLAFRLVEQK